MEFSSWFKSRVRGNNLPRSAAGGGALPHNLPLWGPASSLGIYKAGFVPKQISSCSPERSYKFADLQHPATGNRATRSRLTRVLFDAVDFGDPSPSQKSRRLPSLVRA
jgi:hypothetical protein